MIMPIGLQGMSGANLMQLNPLLYTYQLQMAQAQAQAMGKKQCKYPNKNRK